LGISESVVAEIQKRIEDAFEVFDHDRGHTVDVRYSIFDITFVYNVFLIIDYIIIAVNNLLELQNNTVVFQCLSQYFSALTSKQNN